MSKQQGYQQLSTEYAPDGADYGFAARLPQAGGSYETDKASSSSSGAGVPPMAYPAPAYAGAPVTGYPVMTPSMAGGMAGPVGMGVEDPLGWRDRKRARRQAKRGANGGGRRRAKPGLMLLGGPVGLLVGLARHAIQSGKEHLGKHPPALADRPGSSNQEPARHPYS